jgi:hypothetical protein
LNHPDDVPGASSQTSAGDDDDLTGVAVDLGDVTASLRAAAPVSSSASTTIFPETMCNPPANRSMAETSAFRSQVFVTEVLESSAFTWAVIAMALILPCP